jgi:hypothetical protein
MSDTIGQVYTGAEIFQTYKTLMMILGGACEVIGETPKFH